MVSAERHSKAMEKIGALVNVRERTVKEVRERLDKLEFTPAEVEDAIQTALRVGLINEERYARAFIRGKSHSGWGRAKIVQRLRQNGVSEDIVLACEDEFSSPEQEYESALYELSKRSSSSSNPYASYMRRLVSKGYSYDISKRAVKAFLSSSQ